MKIGLILECDKGGPDLQVCIELAQRLDPEIEISEATMVNKLRLIQDCGVAAGKLLASGCERVVVVWDLYPPWREKGQKPCRRSDRERILLAMQEAKIELTKIGLVCIEAMLEAWLIADSRALSKTLSTGSYVPKIPNCKNVERHKDPKAKLIADFKKYRGESFRYVDRQHARQIVSNLPDLKRLEKILSFQRFKQFLARVKKSAKPP